MENDVPDRLSGFFAPPYDESRRYFWDLARRGERLFAASEGRMLLAVLVPLDRPKVNFPSMTADPPDPTPLLDAPPLTGAPTLAVPVIRLLEWCGPEPKEVRVDCSTCYGSGECTCSCCDDRHNCGHCKGTGKAVESLDPLHGRLLGRRVDRHRLRRLLLTASGECVVTLRMRPPGEKNKEELPFVRVDGDGWVACLMPMDDDDSKPCPAFEEEAPTC